MFYLWLFVAVGLAIIGMFALGWMHYDDELDEEDAFFFGAFMLTCAALWPLIVAFGILTSPFWVGYAVGALLDYRSERKERV